MTVTVITPEGKVLKATLEGNTIQIATDQKPTIKVGQTVNWRGNWGRDEPVKAKIEGIEYCPHGGKYGDRKQEIEIGLKNFCVFSLNNGHWAYGKQIEVL